MGIKSVVDDGTSDLINEAMCSVCEMATVWMQSELNQNETQDRILTYAAEVKFNLVSLEGIVLDIKHVLKM